MATETDTTLRDVWREHHARKIEALTVERDNATDETTRLAAQAEIDRHARAMRALER